MKRTLYLICFLTFLSLNSFSQQPKDDLVLTSYSGANTSITAAESITFQPKVMVPLGSNTR